jgi:periplasmic divalent cation tolerance protein
MHPTHLFYITCGNKEEAQNIAKTAVEKRLAACVNVFSGVESYYIWDDRLQQDDEYILIGKTSDAMLPNLQALVLELHSYETPCFVTTKITGGNTEFMQWVEKMTKNT